TFPAKEDWTRRAVWTDPTIARIVDGQPLARKLSERREQVALLIERAAGPVLHNSTRGDALLMNAPRYGQLLYAMRTPRTISLAEIIKHTGLAPDEVRRFNPALIDRVPAQATLSLPSYVSEFGADVAFWRRPPNPSYVTVLDDFLRLAPGVERWDNPAFAPVLADFKRRFRETN